MNYLELLSWPIMGFLLVCGIGWHLFRAERVEYASEEVGPIGFSWIDLSLFCGVGAAMWLILHWFTSGPSEGWTAALLTAILTISLSFSLTCIVIQEVKVPEAVFEKPKIGQLRSSR